MGLAIVLGVRRRGTMTSWGAALGAADFFVQKPMEVTAQRVRPRRLNSEFDCHICPGGAEGRAGAMKIILRTSTVTLS